ncbi:hypothetical protein AURDEDRAFT_174181 [Auricularia subglabra TFB-10046 SS5]|nr:hypothetical protein AURDEDRAFT_174181 [Auricularia subglabra TFB-10046 SS5]
MGTAALSSNWTVYAQSQLSFGIACDEEEPHQFLVDISQGARFSLRIDGSEYLKEFGISSTFFDHYMDDGWVRVKVDLLLHVYPP